MVELLVAMAIIGLLIATAIWGIGLAQQGARNTQRRETGAQILAGLSEYYSRYNTQATCVWGYTSNSITISNASPCTGTAGVQAYTITANGAANPLGARDLSTSTSPVPSAYKTDASAAYYVVRTSSTATTASGYMVCVYLEGGAGGFANLSDPSTLPCPLP